MSFVERFGPPPPREEPERPPEPPRPVWFGPPEEELGVAVHLGAVVGRSEQGVVALSRATAYSNGLRLHVVARARGVYRGRTHRLVHEQHHFEQDEELTDGFLRLGLELPGGALVSSLSGRSRRPFPRWDEEPEGPVFFEHGGGGGSGPGDSIHLRQAYWLWPLPEPGAIYVSCEWPIVKIPLSTVEIDGASLVAAADRVVRLW